MTSVKNTRAKFDRHSVAILTIAKYSGIGFQKMISGFEQRLHG